MLTALSVLCLVFLVGIAAALVLKYWLTKDPGFLWLGAALVVWPLITAALRPLHGAMIERLVSARPVQYFPWSLIEQQQITAGELTCMLWYAGRVVQYSLVLVGISLLCRSRPPTEPGRADAECPSP